MSGSNIEQVGVTIGTTGQQNLDAAIKGIIRLTAEAQRQNDMLRKQAQQSFGYAKHQRELAKATEEAAQRTTMFASKLSGLAASTGLVSGSIGQLAGTLTSVGPMLEAVQERINIAAKGGSKLAGSIGSAVGQLGAMVPAAVAAVAVAGLTYTAYTKVAESFNSVAGEAARLDAAWDRSLDAASKIREAQERLGLTFNTGREAIKAMREEVAKLQASAAALTFSVTNQDAATAASLSTLLKMRDTVAEMSDGELVRYKTALDAAVASARANGQEIDDVTLGLQKQLTLLTANSDALAESSKNFERAFTASHALGDSQRNLAAQLKTVYDKSSLTATGLAAVAQQAIALVKENERLAETTDGWVKGPLDRLTSTLDTELNAQLERLGVNLEDARAAMERMSTTGESFQAAMKSIAGGIDWKTQGASIQAAHDAALRLQTERWKREADERAAYEKQSMADVIKAFGDEWHETITESSTYWVNQFDRATVSISARMNALLSQAGKAMSSRTPIKGGSGPGGEAATPEEQAEAIMRKQAQIKAMKDSLAVIERRFSRRGNYKEAVDARIKQIDEAEAELRQMRGQGKSQSDRQNDRWAKLNPDANKSTEQLMLERELGRAAKASEDTHREVRRVAAASERTAAAAETSARAAVDSQALLRASGATEAEAARLLAGMAGKSRMPKSVFDVSSRSAPRTGAGSSGSGMRAGGSSGGDGPRTG